MTSREREALSPAQTSHVEPAAGELPRPVLDALGGYVTADLSTFARGGTPITWPVLPMWEPVGERVLVATSIGLPYKAYNIERDPRVALLYSDATGSDLVDPPSVLVQGDAEVRRGILTSTSQLEPQVRDAVEAQAIALFRRQPSVGWYLSNPVSRAAMSWYFLRLLIVVRPRVVSWGWGPADRWERLHVE